MFSSTLLLYFSTLFLLTPSLLADCPPTKPADPIPGCWGEPGCAYIIASDLGPGAACKFDYCNCGGINVPLLPTTINNKTTIGCGAYTTVPTKDNCPTAPAFPGGSGSGSNKGGGGGGGAVGGPLPTSITTGGPISTASDAFATTASSVTTLSYQGGALTYTRATLTSLSALTSTTTITATVTKTASTGGAVATYVGPIVVGPHGVFWGPPGTAPNCVWPFCTGSGPSAGGNGVGGDGKGGGGAGGNFGCQDCLGGGGTNGQGDDSGRGGGGGDGNGGGGKGGGGNGEGGNGGGGNGGGGDGGGGNGGGKDGGGNGGENGEPPPEACPGAKRIKRSDSSTSTSNRIIKRAEEQIVSTNPLKDALNNFSKDGQGNSLVNAALDTAEGILTNKFPKNMQNAYITGLEGHYALTQRTVLGTGDNQQTFQSGTRLFWRVRWDFDPAKGPHVNAQFGTHPSSKFAYNLDSSKFTDGEPKKTMENIVKNLNKQCKYSAARNTGKDQPTWDSTEQQAIDDLKNYFKSVANGPC